MSLQKVVSIKMVEVFETKNNAIAGATFMKAPWVTVWVKYMAQLIKTAIIS